MKRIISYIYRRDAAKRIKKNTANKKKKRGIYTSNILVCLVDIKRD